MVLSAENMYDSEEDDRRRRGRDDRKGYGRDHNGSNKRPAARTDDYPQKRSRIDDAADSYDPKFSSEEASSTLLTFKKFLITQPEEISDEEAIQKYNDYKFDFKKNVAEKFFQKHKDEEWFRIKYNPDDQRKAQEAQKQNIENRLKTFNELKEAGKLEGVSLDFENSDNITKLLDAAVVKLENGSEAEVDAIFERESAENGKKPCKYQSVFLSNIPPSVTFEELEALSKKSPGFVRLAISDADPERRFMRKGWVTFSADVNIKEICWTFNLVRIRDTDLQATVNREILKRVRQTNGVTGHKEVAETHLQAAIKLIAISDKRAGLFNAAEQSEEDREKDIRSGEDLVETNTNPILKEILSIGGEAAQEQSEEELELLGNRPSDETILFERDEQVLKALDLAVLYLRIVHSIDLYNQGAYVQEDKMPHRLALIHVRGPAPTPAVNNTDDDGNVILTKKFVKEYSTNTKRKLEQLVEKSFVSEEELVKLGKKDGDEAVEEFIKKNTVELAADKWLCPLSGKKFKGSEFIRKHLQSKHEHKLVEAKEEAFFFNNYLADPERPMDVEAKIAPVAPRDPPREDEPVSKYGIYGGGGAVGDKPANDHERGGRNSNRHREPAGRKYFEEPARRTENHRPQVSYRDLDAPDEIP